MNGSASRSTLEALLSSLRRPVLYVEKGVAQLITISDFTCDAHGFDATATSTPAPGLPSHRSTWRFGGAWSETMRSDGVVACSYGGWRLVTSEDDIAVLLALVAHLPPGKSYLDDFTSKEAPPGSRFTSIRVPGKVATAVSDFLSSLDR